MALTDAKRRANNKYIAANMTTLGCKMRKDRAAEFKAACAGNGTSPNAVFTAAANAFMASNCAITLLPVSAIQAAETAAAAAGEDTITFLERAISTQAAIDLEHLRESRGNSATKSLNQSRSESRSDSGKVDGKVAEPV